MPFHPNSFSHNRFGPSNEFTTRFANNWALVVSLPIEFDDAESAPRGLIEISVLSGQKLMELDMFGSTTLLVSPDMYAEVLQACKRMPVYDPNLSGNSGPNDYLTDWMNESNRGVQFIRDIVSASSPTR
jgi:hypothetical protein